jgi:hypothetical protein
MVLACLAAAAAVFLVDYAVFRVRLATGREPFGAVTVRRFYAVQQKNGKTEFLFNPPASESCVNALFPHSGEQPCWYLRRHPEQRTDI